MLGLFLGILAALSAAITTPDKGKTFVVVHEAGAAWGCVVFRMVEPTENNSETWPDGHYAPRHCFDINPTSQRFVVEWNPYIYDPKTGKDYGVEWDVYAELQYPEANRTDAFTEVETNRVRVTR